MKYIVSVVMTKVTKVSNLQVNGNGHLAPAQPDISLQNVVGVCNATDADEAYQKVSRNARLQFPDHKIAIKVVVQANEADLEE